MELGLDSIRGVIAHRLLPVAVEPWRPAGQEAIVGEIRLPRSFLAAMVGAGLSLVGASLQSVAH